jgi:hypothetical protein
MAVFFPIPGSLEISLTASSTSLVGKFIAALGIPETFSGLPN